MLEFTFLSPLNIFQLNLTNYDMLTENFQFEYYLYYLLNHSNEIFAMSCSEKIIGYLIGKAEENSTHISILTVASSFRSNRIGNFLMELFENHTLSLKKEFIDLFVRPSNSRVIKFYERRAYYIYKEIPQYYSNPVESAYDMRMYFDGKN